MLVGHQKENIVGHRGANLSPAYRADRKGTAMTARSRLAGLRPRATGPEAVAPEAGTPEAGAPPAPDRLTRALAWFAGLAIGAAILDMIFVSLAGLIPTRRRTRFVV